MYLRPSSSKNNDDALDVLRNGGVIAHATETCYGLACDLSNPEAVAKLFRIKKRPNSQPVSALFASVEQAKEYVEWNDEAEELARKYLPGPLTLILPMRLDAPHQLFVKPDAGHKTQDIREKDPPSSVLRLESYVQQTLGIRLSSSSIAQELVSRFGRPISTTSSNIHGEPNPYDAKEIAKRFESEIDQPDLILDSGILPPTPPSTIIDLTKNGVMHRKGEIQPL